jgi:hypothetical protein
LGAAIVALLLISSGELGVQARTASEAIPGAAPLMLGEVGVQLSVRSESRAGTAPLVADGPTQAFVAEVLTPALGLELRRPSFTLQAFYTPRIFWEDPNPDSVISPQPLALDAVTRIRDEVPVSISNSGPLILHTLSLNLDARPARRVTLSAAAIGSIGSPDYTALPVVLGTVQGKLPPVVNLVSGTAQLRLHVAASRRWDLGLSVDATSWHWLDIPPNLPVSIITGETLITVAPGATFRLSTRDTLGFSVLLGEASYSDGVGVLTATPAVTWRRHLNPRDDLRLTLGLTYLSALGATPPGDLPVLGASGWAIGPIGSFELTSRLLRVNGMLVLASVGGGEDFYIDPVLGVAVPRGSVGAGLAVIAPPRWMLGLRGDFGTAIRTTPYQIEVGGLPPDETVFAFNLFVRRWISQNLATEIGGTWADRGPALVTPDFAFHQRQLWLYVALTATTRPIPRLTQ